MVCGDVCLLRIEKNGYFFHRGSRRTVCDYSKSPKLLLIDFCPDEEWPHSSAKM